MNALTRHLRTLMLLLLISTSCSDESNIFNQSPITATASADQYFILEAKEAHNDIVKSLSQNSSTSGRSNASFRGSLGRNTLWDKARVVTLSVGKGVFVPLKFDANLYAEDTQVGWKTPINKATHLLVYKGIDQVMHSEVVTTLPDKAYVESTTKTKFTGTSVIEDWQGNFIKGYQYKEDGFTAITSSQSSSGKVQCVITDWFNCVAVNQGPMVCSYSYTTSICVDDGGGSDGGGGGSGTGGGDYGGGGGGGGNGGGGSPSLPAFSSESSHNRLCGSINFSSIGNSYTAQLYGLGLFAVNNSSNQRFNVELGPVCLTIPNYGLLPFAAYEEFKLAWAQTINDILSQLDAGTLPANSASVRTALAVGIRSRLRTGSAFTTGVCLGTVTQTTVEYCP